jgi:hypothetical protein
MILDVSSLRPNHKQFIQAVKATIQTALKNAGREAQDQVIASTAFKGEKVKHTVYYRINGQIVQIYTANKIARFMESGTVPHIIRARKARFLSFFWKKVNAQFIGKQVNHPGTKPTLFLRKATDIAFEKMKIELNEKLPALKIGDQ